MSDHPQRCPDPYYAKQPSNSHQLITSILQLVQLTQPNMPVQLTRKIAQDHGLDINERMLANMLGHLCDMQLHGIIKNIKQDKGKTTKKAMSTISKAQVSKALYARGLFSIGTPTIYPVIAHDPSHAQHLSEYIDPSLK